MKEVVDDYLWLYKWDDIDNKKLYDTCIEVDRELQKHFPPINDENVYGCFTSYYHQKYNLFSFPDTELQKLYSNMVKDFFQVLEPNTQYYVRCWPNLFAKNNNIDWHSHWLPEYKTYHGFYCVNTEGENPSHTDYDIPGQKDIIRIMSEDGLCVFGKSDGDGHRSSEWLNDNKFRITIAFDVIPVETLRPESKFTHELLHNYIPLAKMS